MTLTSDDVQKGVRAVGYIIFTALATYANTKVDPSTQGFIIGIVGNVAMAIWTIYGSRINAKLANVEALKGVHIVVDETEAAPAVVAAANDDNRPKIVLKPAA